MYPVWDLQSVHNHENVEKVGQKEQSILTKALLQLPLHLSLLLLGERRKKLKVEFICSVCETPVPRLHPGSWHVLFYLIPWQFSKVDIMIPILQTRETKGLVE